MPLTLVFVQLGGSANVTLVCLGFISVLFYSMLVVSMWRLSRKVSPFILFTSHVRLFIHALAIQHMYIQGIADIYVIAAVVIYSKARSQLRWYPFNDPLLEYWLLSLAHISAYLHVVLIAANRAYSMLFPLSYKSASGPIAFAI